MSKNVLAMKHFEVPREEGTWWRLMCLTGQTKGEAYILTGNRIVMGRSEKADVRVLDIKSSREHAEITRVGKDWVLTDLGSQNGIVVNDQKVSQLKLKEGDKIVIGQTVYKFAKVEVKGPEASKAKKPDLDEGFNEVEPQKKKSSALLGLVAAVGIGLILLDDSDTPKARKKESASSKVTKDVTDEYLNLVRQKQMMEDKALKQKMNTIFNRGLREYREKNYFRAINEFNLALILNPSDPLADFYLRKAKEELDKVIADEFIKGKRDEEALRYQNAIVTYCSIIRLLYQYKEDERYKSAEENIKNLEGKLGLEPGESNCLKKQQADQ
ncbi:MAG: FHA domain-containing protein [Bacteriovoracia bacterium]